MIQVPYYCSLPLLIPFLMKNVVCSQAVRTDPPRHPLPSQAAEKLLPAHGQNLQTLLRVIGAGSCFIASPGPQFPAVTAQPPKSLKVGGFYSGRRLAAVIQRRRRRVTRMLWSGRQYGIAERFWCNQDQGRRYEVLTRGMDSGGSNPPTRQILILPKISFTLF